MHWTEPATADDSHAALEKTLWNAANQLWSNAALKPSKYSPTVLGLIFLRYADVRFAAEVEFLVPHKKIRELAGTFFVGITAQLANLHRRNQNLWRTRDLLLPKLLQDS